MKYVLPLYQPTDYENNSTR